MELPAVFSQAAVPAHLKAISAADVAKLNADAARGASNGDVVNEIRLKGSKFRLFIEGKETKVLAVNELQLVVIHANPNVSKTFYLKEWNPDDVSGAPDCRSANGITPHSEIAVPQAATCATCPNNEWGSKVNKLNGKKSKSCADNKRLAVVPPNKLDGDMFRLSIPPASLADWGSYVKQLNQVSPAVPYMAVVTEVSFDTNVSYPKLLFKPVRYLTGDEFQKIMARFDSDEAKTVADLDNGVPPAAVEAPKVAPAPPVAQTAQAPAAQATPAAADGWADDTPAATPAPEAAAKPGRKKAAAQPAPAAVAQTVEAGWGDTPAPAAAQQEEAAAFDNSGTGAVVSGGDLDDVFGGGW